MKKTEPKAVRFSAVSAFKGAFPRSNSTALIQRKPSIAPRILNEQGSSHLPLPALKRMRVLPRLKSVKLNNSMPAAKIFLPPEQQHRHRLSIDGSLGLEVMLMEHGDDRVRPKIRMKVRGTVVAVTKEHKSRYTLLKPTAIEPRIIHHSDVSEDSDDSQASNQPRYPASRRTSTMTRNLTIQSFAGVSCLEPQKTVQRFAFRSQTGTIAGKPKKNNQDSFLICQDFAGSKNQWLFGVFDGHGPNGHSVSAHIKRSLPQHLQEYLTKTSKPLSEEEVLALSQGFHDSFMHINNELMRSSHIDSSVSGSTAVSVLVKGDFVLCANTGDSRAIIGRMRSNEEWVSVPLSKDHKPDDPIERGRIERAGGRVEPSRGKVYIDNSGRYQGPARVWQQHDPTPGLAMSRSLGDFVAAELGVSSEPDVTRMNLGKEDKFLVLATDGLWEFISNQQCASLVAPYWITGNVDGACERLVKEALACWKKVKIRQDDEVVDDITVILAFFAP